MIAIDKLSQTADVSKAGIRGNLRRAWNTAKLYLTIGARGEHREYRHFRLILSSLAISAHPVHHRPPGVGGTACGGVWRLLRRASFPSCSPTGEYIGDLLEEEFTFAHNVVRTVIDTARERLEVTGFTVNGSGAGVNTEVRLLRSGNGGKQTDGRRADPRPSARAA